MIIKCEEIECDWMLMMYGPLQNLLNELFLLFYGRGNFFPSKSSNSKVHGLMMRIILNVPSQLTPSLPFL